MTIEQLLVRLRRERFDLDAPELTEADRAFRHGWNSRTDNLIQHLEQARTLAGLAELAEVAGGPDNLTSLAARETP